MATAVAAAALLAGCRTTPSGGAEPTTAPRPDVDEHALTGDGGRSLDFDVRGYEVVGPDGNPIREPGARSSVLTVDELEQAAPPGVRIAVMGTTVSRAPHGDDPTWRHENVDAGLPGDAVVTQPDVQGLILEDESGDLVSGMVDDDPATWGPDWRPPGAKAAARGTAFDWLADQIDEAT